MKTINLNAFNEFSLDDLSILLAYLGNVPSGEISLDQVKKLPPVRTSKIGPIVKIAEEFGLISKKQDRLSVTASGLTFSRSGLMSRKTTMRTLFGKVEQIQRLLDILALAPSGRLAKKTVLDTFNLGSPLSLSDRDIDGFIAWGQLCDLFGYDKKKEEIFRLELGTPKGPTEITQRLGNVYTLPRAS